MVAYGYTLSSEEHGPSDLVRNAAAGGGVGLRLRLHLRPLPPLGERPGPQPVRVVGAGGDRGHGPNGSGSGVGVTCPIMRIHPAVVAHATATTSLLFEGRFFFGVGSGEALNEHILGDRWPPPGVRLDMLEEAVDVIRALWTGETVDHRGAHYEVENARLFDPPAEPPPIVVSAFGPKAIDLAARIGDGYWGHAPEPGADRALPRGRRHRADATPRSTCAGPRTRSPPARLSTRSGPTAASRAAVAGPAHVDPLRGGRRRW